MTSSSNVKKRILIIVVSVLVTLLLVTAVLAYYEYYGQYSGVINLDGSIRLDAFGELYEQFRGDSIRVNDNDYSTYGVTPENPFVISNLRHFQNLIKLNNSGKLARSKERDNVEKYYFCLEFDETEVLPQVLNLQNEGIFSTIGNNEHPFEDELSGIVYAYELDNQIVYYSGCLDTVEVTIVEGHIYYDGVDSGTNASLDTVEGTYLKVNRTYYFDEEGELAFTNDPGYIPLQRLTVVHQMIANATMVADTNQLDIGFFNNISAGADVHDVILYNINIVCQEDVAGTVHGNLFTLFSNLLNGTSDSEGALTSHNTAQDFAERDYKDERHIGIFAGHIDGNASNISVGGLSNISIATEDVNYYSQYTTVGFISENATIGGIQYSNLFTDLTDELGNVSGCMFADFIYSSATKQSGLHAGTVNGIDYYLVRSVDANTANNWDGVDTTIGNGVFTYGSFQFLLSSGSDDTVNNLWANKSESKLLYEQGYNIYQSVLYCVDEYRYASEGTPTGALVNGAASVDESKYTSIGPLESNGSILDAGKYLITAYVNINGVEHYYALKLTAEAQGDDIVCSFDTSDDCDVTDFITSEDGSTTIFSSSLWTIDEASETPSFVNSRFEGNYLQWIYDGNNYTANIDITTDSNQKTNFIYSSSSNALYFEKEYELSGGVFGTHRYYLSYNYNTGTWSITNTPGGQYTTNVIKMFKVSNGYTLRRVDDLSQLVANNDYVIVAYDAINERYRMLGINASIDGESGQWLIEDGINSTDLTYTTMPTSVSVEEYENMLNYIWYTTSATNGVCTFVDRISTEYGLLASNGLTVSASNILSWTYSVANHTLNQGGNYLTYSYVSESETGFGVGNAANSSIYIYQLVVEDSDPQYITYDGAKYIHANSTLLKAANYVISIEYDNKHYLLNYNNGTTLFNDLNSFSSYTMDQRNQVTWNLATDSTSCQFTNVYRPATILTLTGHNYWMYDAASHRFYYIDNGETYYVSFNGSSMSTTTTEGSAARVHVYRIDTEYSYGNVTLLQTTTSILANLVICVEYNGNRYAINGNNGATVNINDFLTLTEEQKNLVTWRVGGSSSPYTYTNVGNNSTLRINNNTSLTYNTTNHRLNNGERTARYLTFNGSTIGNTTTANSAASVYFYEYNSYDNTISAIEGPKFANTSYQSLEVGNDYYYFISTQPLDSDNNPFLIGGEEIEDNIYGLKYTSVDDQYTYQNNTLTTTMDLGIYAWHVSSTNKVTKFGNLPYRLYEFKNHTYSSLYLAGSNASSDRELTVGTTSNVFNNTDPNGNEYINGATTSNVAITGILLAQHNHSGNSIIGIKGSGNTYLLYSADNGTSSKLENGGQGNNAQTWPATMYIYVTSRPVLNSILTLVSSDGDTLDQKIHYLFAAKNNNDYIALSFDQENPGSAFYGEKVTSPVRDIIEAGDAGFLTKASIPVNSDWCQTQLSTDIRLQFYHTKTSTSGSFNYLDTVVENNSLILATTIIQQGAVNNIYWYYDIVNQRLSFVHNSTTYYVVYDANFNTFELTDDASEASRLFLIRFTPTYNVSQVTEFGEDYLEAGEFIIAGHSAQGFTALGTQGYANETKNVTNYLTTELSEADYKQLPRFIWEQSYYAVAQGSNYTNDATNSKIHFQMSSLSGVGSIEIRLASSNYYFAAKPSSTIWDVSPSSTAGLWNIVMENQTNNNYYLQFKDTTRSPNLSVSEPTKDIVNYIGNYTNSFTSSFNTNSANIYLYDTNGNRLNSAPTVGNSYLMVAECSNVKVVLKNNNGTIEREIYSSSKLNQSAYQWTVAAKENGFSLSNSGYQAYVNNGNILLSVSAVDGFFVSTNGVLSYTVNSYTNYYLYRTNNNNTITVTSNSGRYAFLYEGSYTTSGNNRNYTFRQVPLDSAQSGNALIFYNGDRYYILRINNNGLSSTRIDNRTGFQNSNGVITFSYGTGNADLTSAEYQVAISKNGEQYSISRTINNTTYYLTLTNSSASVSTTPSYYQYDGNQGIYYRYQSGSTRYNTGMTASASYGFSTIGYPTGDSTGATVVFYKKEGDYYYNIGYDTTEERMMNQSTSLLNDGSNYIMYVMYNGIYYLLGYDPDNVNLLVLTVIGENLPVFPIDASILENDYANSILYATRSNISGSDFDHVVSLKFSGYTSENLCLYINGSVITTSTSNSSFWEYNFRPANNNSRLYTVTQSPGSDSSLAISGSVMTRGSSETYLYSYNSETKEIGNIVTNLSSGGNYVIVLFQNGSYYLMKRTENGENDYSVIPHPCGSGVPSVVTDDDVWTFSAITGGYSVTVPGHSACYLEFGSSQSLGVSYQPVSGSSAKWTYSSTTLQVAQFNRESGVITPYTSLDNNFTKDLYIFKVTMSNNLDSLSDTKTSLGYKSLVKSSLNTTSANSLVMIASVGSGAGIKYYALSMNDTDNIKTMDVTDVMKDALTTGGAISLFDASVWSNLGQDFTLVFNNKGLSTASDLYLFSADSDYLNNGVPTSPVVAEDANDLSKYTWSLQTFNSGGDMVYLYGYQDPTNDEGVFTYVYFDDSDLSFKTTTNSLVALASNKYVQLYQLGRKITLESGYQTLEISLADDHMTITSFPLYEVEPEDIVRYTPGDQNTAAEGEYMIMTIVDGVYYALTYNSQGELSFADVSMYFNGHFDGRGDLDTYCISVNKRYLWKQTATPTILDGSASDITFQNIGTNGYLSLQDGDNNVLSFMNNQLFSTVSLSDYFLNFTTANGYSVSTSESTTPIHIYAVGANSIDTGDDSGSLQYVYYNYGLNSGSTSGINYNNFSFTKERIEELPKYAMDYSGSLVHSDGWTLIGDTIMTEVNSTVLFEDGITLSSDVTTMSSKFHQRTYNYSFKNEEDEDIEGSIDYYAPEGSIAFAVADASPTKPVFVNIIVSTEQEMSYSELLRYLAVWKVASIDAENESLETLLDYDETLLGAQESSLNSVYDFAYTLSTNFYIPSFAIPLPNILSADKTSEMSASFVKIKNVENGEATYEQYWLSDNGENDPYNHLIAHTFTISSPGVYYIGSTSGSVSVSYLYIGDMLSGEVGEATGMDISERFTIDFVWGTMANSGEFGTDDAIGTVAYVLRDVEDNDSLTWVHSNIYPFFTNGTAGLYTGDTVPEGYNPTDELVLTVQRTYTPASESDPAYSTVAISATTTDEIYDDGNGVQYYNMNNASQRQTRRVTLEFPNQPNDDIGG